MWQQILLAAVRHGLSGIGITLVAKGLATGDEVTDAIGAILILVGFGWSVYRKWKAAKVVVPGVMLVLLATSSFAQAPAEIPASAPTFVQEIKAGVLAIGGKVDIGGGYTFLANTLEDWDIESSLSAIGKLRELTWEKGRWEYGVGLAYSYVPAWDDHFGGLAGWATLFDTPKMVMAVREAIPGADIVTPRAMQLKFFAAIQTQLEEEKRLAFSAGFSVPF